LETTVKKKDKKKSKGGGGGKAVDFGRYLRGLNKHLDEAKEKAESSGFEEFDDGRYSMRCVDAKIGVSKNKRVQVVLTWKFLGGDYKGKEKLDFEGLTEDHLPYLLKKLDAMGYDTSELENLEEELKAFLDDIKKTKPKCKVRLKTKGEFQNLYVDGPLDEDDEEEDDEEEESPKKSKKKSKKKDDEDDDDEDEEEDSDDDEDSDDEEESDDDDEGESEDEEEESDNDDEDEDEDEEEDDEEEDAPKKKKGAKKKSKSKDDDDEEEDEEEDEDEEDDEEEEVEDEVDVVVGSIVKATSKKEGKVKGEVVELFEKEGKVLIKTDKGKTLKLKAEAITSVEESPAESVPSKKKKKKSKK
jgi:hypothetical protein